MTPRFVMDPDEGDVPLALDDPRTSATFLDLVPCALIEMRVHPDGRRAITYFNRGAEEMFGYTQREAVGADALELLRSEFSELQVERARETLIEAGYWEGEAINYAKDGRAVHTVARVASRVNAAGEPDLNLLAARDVTAERTLRARLAEQAALLELAPDAIVACDAQTRITFWNKAAEIAYGYSREEALGHTPSELLHTAYPIPREEIERIVVETGAWEGDLEQTTKDGRRLVVATKWGALRDQDGELVGLQHIDRDATERLALRDARERASAEAERARLSQRLVRAQRLESLGQLAGGIAHDFNNLLAVIAGYATVLTGSLEDLEGRLPAATREALLEDVAEIARAAQRAGDLTHQLLAFARQESVRAEPLSLNEVIVDVRELLARTIGEHVQLETALADDLHPVLADEGQLGQVLVNLAVNARDAMPDGGRLIIETANVTLDEDDTREDAGLRSGPHVQMRVTDTGTGLAPDALEHAFDPFFTTKAAGGGAGLGLATVYGIITQAGGRATLYSEPGQGTTFSAIFPAVDGTRPDRAVVGTALELAPGRRAPTVLLVEDQPALRAVTARLLGRAGYSVLTAGSGPEALEAARATPGQIDLLLTDVVMPDMLGQQLAVLLHEERPQIRVIFTSGFARPALEHGGHQLAGPLLQKPFSAGELLAQVADTLDLA